MFTMTLCIEISIDLIDTKYLWKKIFVEKNIYGEKYMYVHNDPVY